jgi:DNA-binding NtrC family response regulator
MLASRHSGNGFCVPNILKTNAPEHDSVNEEMKRILYVEDNFDECELVKAILTDYNVTCVATVAKARPLLAAVRHALVIIDEHLPDGSGMMLCNQLTKRDADTPVIIVSGDPYVTLAEAREAGAKTFLSKSSQTYVEDLKYLTNQLALSAKAKP